MSKKKSDEIDINLLNPIYTDPKNILVEIMFSSGKYYFHLLHIQPDESTKVLFDNHGKGCDDWASILTLIKKLAFHSIERCARISYCEETTLEHGDVNRLPRRMNESRMGKKCKITSTLVAGGNNPNKR